MRGIEWCGCGLIIIASFHALVGCRRPVLSSCCRRTLLSHVAVAYNKQQRTMTTVVVRCLVGPFAAIVFAVVHRRLVVVMSWCRVSCVMVAFHSGDIVVLWLCS